MLNRRYLRAKVMQSLYALELSKNANYLIAKDKIIETFTPDWDEKSEADYKQLAYYQQEATQTFETHFQDPKQVLQQNLEEEIRKASLDAIHHYQNQLTRDKNFYAKNLLTQADKIYEIYLMILLFYVELSDLTRHDKESQGNRYQYMDNPLPASYFKLENNPLCQLLANHRILEAERAKRGINWGTRKDLLNEFYRKTLQRDQVYQEYAKNTTVDFEEHKEIIQYILKKMIFRKKTVNYFVVTEVLIRKEILKQWLSSQDIHALYTSFQEQLPNLCQVFVDHLEASDASGYLDKVQKLVKQKLALLYQELTRQEASGKPILKDEKDVSIQEEIGRNPEQLLAEYFFRKSLSGIVNAFSVFLEEEELNLAERQSQNLRAMNESLFQWLQALGIDQAEGDKVTLRIDVNRRRSVVNELFAEMDLQWAEDHKIVQSMVQNTIKAIETAEDKDFPLIPLSRNWEEDRIFYQDLYKKNIQNDERYEEIIAAKSRNWDLNRLALIDKVILKMAICEMIHFYSIPVKVSINEYIELSKMYSTSKSKQFINGLLDAISQELIDKRIIKKSGRGLMDNK